MRDFGRPIVHSPRPFPERTVHRGRSVRLDPLTPAHAEPLWPLAAASPESFGYLRYGPFESPGLFTAFVAELAGRADQPFWSVEPIGAGKPAGWLSLCDVYPADSSIEIGSIWFSPELQRTRAATEAIFLLMRHAFDDLGYERLVWRCAALNEASRKAALRYGFVFEGIWRNAAIAKGYQRDVAWHSILKDEWPAHRAALEAWLDDGNFDADGRAASELADIRKRLAL